MTKNSAQDTPPVTGDPILLNVLATAQRFAAWYAEYLSASVPLPSVEYDAGAERRAEDLARHLQHAVFDLMAAVHDMNRHCATESGASDTRLLAPLAALRAAVH